MIDTKKIGSFLQSVNGAEYRYLELSMQVRNGIGYLMNQYNLSKEEIINRFNIPPKKVDKYIKGNYNYSMIDMACLNTAIREMEVKEAQEREVIKINTEE